MAVFFPCMSLSFLVCLTYVSAAEDPYKKIWTIAGGHDWGAHEYFDEEGYLGGFSHDLISAVCQNAGIQCRTMWMPYTWCWDNQAGQHPVGGIALMDKWVDACYGYEPTLNRIHVFDFTLPFLQELRSRFLVKAGTGSSFDATDIRGKKIAFLDGYSQDEKCLARQTGLEGAILPKESIVHVTSVEDYVNQIVTGAVAAGFGYPEAAEQAIKDGTIEAVMSKDFGCGMTGISMMSRKDDDFATYWNQGFQELRNSGAFKKLCDQAEKEHGSRGSIGCI